MSDAETPLVVEVKHQRLTVMQIQGTVGRICSEHKNIQHAWHLLLRILRENNLFVNFFTGKLS